MTKKTNKTQVVKTAKTIMSTKQYAHPEYKLDKEFQDLLAPLTAEEYKALEKSLREDGLREPLLVWKEKKILVDGYNRHKITKDLKIKEYRVVEKSFASRDEVKLWIWNNQESRRNMSPFRRVEVTLKLKDIIAAEAKKNQRAGGGSGSSKLNKPTIEKVHTYKILAGKAGVSENTYRNAEALSKKIGAGKVKQKDIDALRSGRKTINYFFNKYCVDQSKVKEQPKQGLAERSNSFFKFLKSYVAKKFPRQRDRNFIFKQLSEWAVNEKEGVSQSVK